MYEMEESYYRIGGCKKCKMTTRNEMSVERLNDDKKTVKGFCSLGNALNAGGYSETTVVARTRVEWTRFGECGEVWSKGHKRINKIVGCYCID